MSRFGLACSLRGRVTLSVWKLFCLTSIQLRDAPTLVKVHLAALLTFAFDSYLRPAEALSLTKNWVVPPTKSVGDSGQPWARGHLLARSGRHLA